VPYVHLCFDLIGFCFVGRLDEDMHEPRGLVHYLKIVRTFDASFSARYIVSCRAGNGSGCSMWASTSNFIRWSLQQVSFLSQDFTSQFLSHFSDNKLPMLNNKARSYCMTFRLFQAAKSVHLAAWTRAKTRTVVCQSLCWKVLFTNWPSESLGVENLCK